MTGKPNFLFRKLLILLFFVLVSQLAYSQKVDSVIIGFGGGMTGQVTVYSLSKKVIKKGKGFYPLSYSSSTKYKKSQFKKIAAEAKLISDSIASFSFPFNTYKFLEIHTKGKSVKYTWGDPGHKTPENIENLYNKIITLVNSLNLNKK